MALRNDMNYFLIHIEENRYYKEYIQYSLNFKDLFRHQHGSNIGKNKNV